MIKRIASCVLVIVMLLSALTFFVSAETDDEGINIYYYRLIYSSTASAQTKNAVNSLAQYLNTHCDADVDVAQDNKSAINKEIVIGNTKRASEKKPELKEKDFCIYSEGDKIFINAGSEGALPLAIEYFKANCLVLGSRKVYLGGGKVYNHNYEDLSITINGSAVDDLVLAYSASDHIGYVDAIYTFKYSILERFGVSLDVVDAAEQTELPRIIVASTQNGSKYLPNGVTVGKSQYVICQNGKDVVIVADNSIGAQLALQEIYVRSLLVCPLELVSLCSSTAVNYSYEDDHRRLADYSDHRIMTLNFGRYELNPVDRTDAIMAGIKYYAPDVIGFQEYCAYFTGKLTPKLAAAGYTVLGNELSTSGGSTEKEKQNMTPIAYNSSKLECLASGWQRMQNTYDKANGKNYPGHHITWAIFKNKTSGEVFGVTSTHFFHLNDRNQANPVRAKNSDELLELVLGLKAQYSCPFISLGDYNSWSTDEAYKKLDSSEIFADSRALATLAYGKTAAGHKFEQIKPSTSDCIDLFFVTDEVKVILNEIAANELGASMGDHFPVFMDFSLNGAKNDSETQQNGSAQSDNGAKASVTSANILPAFPAINYSGNAAAGSTTVGRNAYAPYVEVKQTPPPTQEEFDAMHQIPDQEEEEGADVDQAPQDTPADEEKKGGCSSNIGDQAACAVMLMTLGICILNIKRTKKEG